MTGAVLQQSASDTNDRDHRVDSLRGIAIVLLVLYHAIDTGQMQVAVLAWLKELIEPFIMPVFAVISGYVYALRPVRLDSLRQFTMNKIKRIAIPMLVASTGLYLLRAMVSGDQPLAEIWRVWVFSYDYFWFLQSLLLIFLAIVVVDGLSLANRWWSWLIVLVLACIAQRVVPGSDVFSFWGLLYLLPSFLIGLGLQRFGNRDQTRVVMVVATVVALGAGMAHQLAWFDVFKADLARTEWLAQAFGIALAVALILRCPRLRGLIWLAAVSYTIYLYHGPGLAIGERLGRVIASDAVVWVTLGFKFAFGLAIPIVLDLVLRRLIVTRLIVLGRK